MIDQHAEVEARARQTLGMSAPAIYRMVRRALEVRPDRGGVLVDVGCGTGSLSRFAAGLFDRYIGIDLVRYDGFPPEAEFIPANLDSERIPLSDGIADVVVSVETIEHLENPRAFMRELTRLTRPSGSVVVTTPNQLSILSKLTLLLKNQFNAFQDGCYPAHRTALLESDLRRIAAESGLNSVAVAYSQEGRVAFSPWHYPSWLSRQFPRALSDNVLLVARKESAGRGGDSQVHPG